MIELSKEKMRMLKALAKDLGCTPDEWIGGAIGRAYDEEHRVRTARGEPLGDFVEGRPELSLDQQDAINRFAAKHGRTWRTKLRDLWTTGKDADEEDSTELRQIRNAHGPSGLKWIQPS